MASLEQAENPTVQAFLVEFANGGINSSDAALVIRRLSQNANVGTDVAEFARRYGICLNGTQVQLALPSGISHAQFLTEAQSLGRTLHARDAIYPNRLSAWAADPAFTTPSRDIQPIGVDCKVANSNNKTRREQEELGYNDVDLPDLAVAHAAAFVLTGQDIFQDHAVRARGGALYFDRCGLVVFNYPDDLSYTHVSASRALPFRN